MKRTVAFLAGALVLAGCSPPGQSSAPAATTSGTPATTPDQQGQRFPDVTGVEVNSEGTEFAVTVSSPYDTPERYADAIRIRNSDGTVYGVRELAHDHASEQPFTRSVTDVAVPDGVTEVVAEARDKTNGWGGTTQTVTVKP